MTSLGPAAVIIPTLNEAAHIDRLLTQFTAEGPGIVGEILVADGGSSDGTREIVARWALVDDRIRLIDNRERIQAAGINLAVRMARADLPVIIRVDAHAHYPADYAALLLGSMEASGADSVVVRLTTVGETRLQRAIASAQNSLIGTGGSAHRVGTVSQFVDHGHHAAFRRALFVAVGGYDRTFVANEDAEFDVRLRAAGGTIWLDAAIPVVYFPRRTIKGLWRQYSRYGAGRARNFLKHGEPLRLRQLAPPAVVAGASAGLVVAPLFPPTLLLPLAYLLMITACALLMAVREKSPSRMLAAPALATMHFAWAYGFSRSLARPLARRVRTRAMLRTQH